MLYHPTRRRFLKSAAVAGSALGLGDLSFLSRLPRISAAEAQLDPKIVRFPLTIEVPAGATPASHAAEGAYGLINLTTTHPDTKEMTIKVRYVVKE